MEFEADYLDVLHWNGAHLRAWRQGNQWRIQNGFDSGGPIGVYDTLEYTTLDGSGWLVRWVGDIFEHQISDNSRPPHRDKVIIYCGVARKPDPFGGSSPMYWQAEWQPQKKLFHGKYIK